MSTPKKQVSSRTKNRDTAVIKDNVKVYYFGMEKEYETIGLYIRQRLMEMQGPLLKQKIPIVITSVIESEHLSSISPFRLSRIVETALLTLIKDLRTERITNEDWKYMISRLDEVPRDQPSSGIAMSIGIYMTTQMEEASESIVSLIELNKAIEVPYLRRAGKPSHRVAAGLAILHTARKITRIAQGLE